MNDLQIEYFMAVATNLSFTKTSEELYVSQPAISRQISQLEKELETRLFVRNNKRTELTEAGELYFKLFSRYRAELRETKKHVEDLKANQQKTITIGFLEGWDLYEYLPKIIDMFNQKHPEYKVIINCCGIKELSSMVQSGRIDVAVTMKNSVLDIRGIEIIDLCSIGKRLLFSSDSKYAKMKNLTPSDFKDETFIAPWGVIDKLVTSTVTGYMSNYRFTPKMQFVANHESMVTCVRNGMGVAITDEWVWANNAKDLMSIPMDAEDQISIIYLDTETDDIKNYMIEVIQCVYTSDS